jgi:catechol 2,3-dioxygenase-like lactoylglutathione lyase family enzyme
MSIALDHIIVQVNDAKQSIDFYTRVLGFTHDGEDGPFSVIRVTDGFMVLLSPFGTKGGDHLAFSMTEAELAEIFARIKAAGVPYGDSYHSVGNMKGPGRERSARGIGKSVYLFDPNQHLIEILSYDP